jgi:hypothetical protein
MSMKLRSPALVRTFQVLTLSASLTLTASVARADSVTAEALFQSGREALDKGNVEAACERFEESYRLEPRPGTALNLGNCRERLGQVASAWQRFREAAQTLPADDARSAVAKERASALAGKVPKLVLRTPEDAEGWVVLRDGVELGSASLNLALPVDPGSHRIEVRAPGRAPWKTTADVALGEQREVVLVAGNATTPSSADVSLPPSTPERSSPRTLGWVLGGVGVAGVATSLVTGAMVLSKGSTVDKECENKQCTAAGLDAADAGRTLSTVSTVAAVVGAASLGLGIYFLVSGDSTKTQPSALGDRRRTQLGVASAPGGAAFTLRSSF